MTIQEIYDKLNARAAAFQMPFSVKGVASRPLLQGQYIDGVTDTIKKILADETVPDYVAPAVMPARISP